MCSGESFFRHHPDELNAAGRYLGDPIKGTELAMSKGLTAAYAYKLAYERGLLPARDEKLLGRSHTARLAST